MAATLAMPDNIGQKIAEAEANCVRVPGLALVLQA
jgi:hypothetical protein